MGLDRDDDDDLPPKEGDSSGEDHPLLATLQAMERLKKRNEELESVLKNVSLLLTSLQERTTNLEDAFKIAVKDVEGPLKEFFSELEEARVGEKSESGESEDQEEEEEEESDPLSGG